MKEGVSLKNGIYPEQTPRWLRRHDETPKWENHTAHPLRAGKFSAAEAAEGVDSDVSSAAG